MANRFSVTPLGGLNTFQLGQAVGNIPAAYNRAQEAQAIQDAEQLEQQQYRQLLQDAYRTGNQDQIAEVFSRDPRVGEFLSQREAQKLQAIGQENLAQSRQAEIDWGIKWKQAQTPEQKQQLLQEAIPNPLIDVDEGDVNASGPNADLAVDTMLYGHLGKDGFKALITDRQFQRDPYKEQELAIKEETLNVRKLENEERSLDRQIQREKNELQRQELEARLAQNKSTQEQKKRDLKSQADNAVATFDNSLATIDKILESPGFSAAVGSRLPFVDSLPGTAAQETIGLIETLESQNFLNQIEKMKGLGALSNAEGQKVSSAIRSLNRNMSEKAFKRSLEQIKGFLEKGKRNVMQKYGQTETEKTTVNWADL